MQTRKKEVVGEVVQVGRVMRFSIRLNGEEIWGRVAGNSIDAVRAAEDGIARMHLSGYRRVKYSTEWRRFAGDMSEIITRQY
jgi:hypothetical protein